MSEVASDVGGAVTKKIGPLPGYAWVLIVAGTAWGFTLWKRHSAGTSGPVASSVSPAASVDFPPGTGNAGGGIGFSGSTGTVTTTPFGSPPVKTNAQWVSQTANAMVANGADANATSNALSTYINGGQLDANQQALVNTALTHYGSPPEGVVPVKTITDVPLNKRFVNYVSHAGDPTLYGVTSNGDEVGITFGQWQALGRPGYQTAPAHDIGNRNVNQAHIYVVKDGDTLASISQRFYGTTDTSKLKAANPGVSDHPGISSAIYVP
jgi:hypothetical protein